MSRTVSRTRRSTTAGVSSARVVISPATTARSVVTRVSQATRLAAPPRLACVLDARYLTAARSGIRLQILPEPVPGHVQPPLDRADRRLELAAHLLERAAANVKRHERRPIDRLEPVEAGPQLGFLLALEQIVERAAAVGFEVLEDRRLGTAERAAPRQ